MDNGRPFWLVLKDLWFNSKIQVASTLSWKIRPTASQISLAVGRRINLCIKDGVIKSINQHLTRWFLVPHDSIRGSPNSGFAVAPVRYPNLFRASFCISMNCDHNPKLVSFRIMFVMNAELSGGTTICGDEFEAGLLIQFRPSQNGWNIPCH